MNAYVLRVDPMMDTFLQFLLVENTSLTETRVVKASPVRLQNRCCSNQKKLDYEIETVLGVNDNSDTFMQQSKETRLRD